LVLSERGTGSCVVLFKEEVTGTYGIAWHTGGQKLVLACVPSNRDLEAITITPVYVDLMRIQVVIKGKAEKWERMACLYNERELTNRLDKTSRLIKTPERDHP
jgi:hypothetical protein